MDSSEDWVRGSMFERTEAGNRKGSCVRQITLSLIMEPGTVARSMSSRTMLPETRSMRRMIARVDELLPLFVLFRLGFVNSVEVRYIPSCPSNYADSLATFNGKAETFKDECISFTSVTEDIKINVKQ